MLFRSIEPAPQAIAAASTGGLWPAAVSTAAPCPFCTTSTVMARGTTSSTIAFHENAGTYSPGVASATVAEAAGASRPSTSWADYVADATNRDGDDTFATPASTAYTENHLYSIPYPYP